MTIIGNSHVGISARHPRHARLCRACRDVPWWAKWNLGLILVIQTKNSLLFDSQEGATIWRPKQCFNTRHTLGIAVLFNVNLHEVQQIIFVQLNNI